MAAAKKPAAKKPAAKTNKPKGTPAKPDAPETPADETAAAEGGQGAVKSDGTDTATAPESKADAPTVTDAAPGIDHDDKGYIGDKPSGPDDAAYALPSGPSSPSAAESSPQATDG